MCTLASLTQPGKQVQPSGTILCLWYITNSHPGKVTVGLFFEKSAADEKINSSGCCWEMNEKKACLLVGLNVGERSFK